MASALPVRVVSRVTEVSDWRCPISGWQHSVPPFEVALLRHGSRGKTPRVSQGSTARSLSRFLGSPNRVSESPRSTSDRFRPKYLLIGQSLIVAHRRLQRATRISVSPSRWRLSSGRRRLLLEPFRAHCPRMASRPVVFHAVAVFGGSACITSKE